MESNCLIACVCFVVLNKINQNDYFLLYNYNRMKQTTAIFCYLDLVPTD